MPRKKVHFHKGGYASPHPRGKNAFARESAQITRRTIWGTRYQMRNRWSVNVVIRNPRMKPLLQNGKAHRG